jgi:hypothetical protein
MDPLWIGGILLAILILVLVLAYLLFYKEQSFEDAIASQQASSTILIQSKNSGGKANLKQRVKKPKKERPKSEGESEKISKQDEVVLEASEENDLPVLPKSLRDEAASLFESIPGKPTAAESSEEEKPVQKPKKRARDKKKSDHNRGVVETPLPKEQEPAPVKEEILVQESFVKTNAEQTLEGIPPMFDEEPLFPKEEPVIPAGSSGKKAKKSKGPKEKQSSAGIYVYNNFSLLQ